jgi:hypothetical protein
VKLSLGNWHAENRTQIATLSELHESGGDQQRLLAVLGNALLREDRNFHSIQMIEAVFGQWMMLQQIKMSMLDQ